MSTEIRSRARRAILRGWRARARAELAQAARGVGAVFLISVVIGVAAAMVVSSLALGEFATGAGAHWAAALAAAVAGIIFIDAAVKKISANPRFRNALARANRFVAAGKSLIIPAGEGIILTTRVDEFISFSLNARLLAQAPAVAVQDADGTRAFVESRAIEEKTARAPRQFFSLFRPLAARA